MDRFFRVKALVGDKFNKFQSAKILIAGVGGVGGIVVENLCRSGFKNIIIVDNDKFEDTNFNRQIGSEFVGINKVDYFAKKFSITGINKRIDENFSLDEFKNFDFFIDCIDDIRAKIKLAKFAYENKINFISSCGSAKRSDPSKVKISKIFNTYNDPFAKKFRYELKKAGLDNFNFDCVFSSEEPKIKELGSLMCVTSTFGNFIASVVINKF